MLDVAGKLPRPPMIAGDCNDGPDGPGPADFTAAGWIDAWMLDRLADVDGSTNWTAGTRLGRPPTQRLDYVFVPPGWLVLDAAVLAPPDRLDWFAERSDHLPLVRNGQPAGTAAMSGDPPVSLVAKIRKLLAKAEGTDNPNEAEAFSAKAAQLIAAHRIDPRHVAEALASGELGLRRIVIGRGAYVRARLALLAAVAGNHDCEVVFETGPHGTTATIAGYQSDLDVTEVLYTSLHAQAANQMAAVRRRTPAATQRWRRSFLFGFARRVAELLAAAREDARVARAAEGAHGSGE